MSRTAFALLLAAATLSACSSSSDPNHRITGQTDFISAPLAGNAGGNRNGIGDTAGGGAAPGAPSATPQNGVGNPQPRTVEETDLYRLDGNRLYYLNAYRGLMVFDVSDVDHPTLVGRSAIYGSPVEMLVRNGIAVIVVADWFGALDDGTPFHGSIVRGLDATDPSNIRALGEAKLGGWVRDTRVVGDVLYAVSEDYGWSYGWGVADAVGGSTGGGVSVPGHTTQPTETVIVSSVSFANNSIQAVGHQSFPGYSGIFNVTPSSILLAHDPGGNSAKTELLYLDISDPAGAIVQRGSIVVDGRAQGWGADNGRWNLDFADGKTAHVVGCAGGMYGCDSQSGYLLDTVDFSNPDAPALKSTLAIPGTGWSAAARFDTNRLYLSPTSYYGNTTSGTPFMVYDTTDPAAPKLAGSATIPGTVWNILPAPQQRIFALGNDWSGTSGTGDSVSLKYLDVTNAAAPKLLGTSTFGQGWAWTPAAGTFKAFTMDATKGLVVLPFSGWSSTAQAYNNGLQLIEFTPTTTRTAGAARSKGWVERGIFVGTGAGTRLVSLSDLALSVVDYSNHDAPAVTAELTLARNVIAAQPGGATIAEISSDWWDNDVTSSEVRVLPIGNAEETTDVGGIATAAVDGVNARVFRNGDLAYVVTNVRVPAVCPGNGSSPPPGGGTAQCFGRAEQIQVVDLAGGGATLRGKVQLPVDTWGYGWWGWWGFYWYDWFDGAEALQVGKDALAFRRWQPIYDGNGYYVDGASALYVVDLANADAPSLASVTITTERDGWWGNMRIVGDTLYTTHYEWFQRSGNSNSWTVKYYASRIDLSDRKHPRVESKINVPGLIVGGSDKDSSILYTIDYRWDGSVAKNDFDVLRLHGHLAELLSKTTLDGWVGSTFIRGDKAYMSAQQYDQNGGGYGTSHVNLHALDLSNPSAPVDHVASDQKGWGWLLDVEGDRAIVSSGWGQSGVDIYRLSDGAAPQFSQFARTRGWWTNAVTRQDSALFLSSGYWGVQRIDLQ